VVKSFGIDPCVPDLGSPRLIDRQSNETCIVAMHPICGAVLRDLAKHVLELPCPSMSGEQIPLAWKVPT
jgi:hypothetical protein